MKDLLEVLRVQRHNFLNHLQVISGLLQLKKHDKIMDYIMQIGNDYNQDSLVGRMNVPEIVVALLSSDLAAGKQGIIIKKEITTDLDKGIVKEQEAAQILRGIINNTIVLAMNSGYQERVIELEIKEEAARYVFRLKLPCKDPGEEFETNIGALKTKAIAVGGEIEVKPDNGLIVLSLKIPVCDNNTGK
ncbi:MAG TPA: Spo0B domain-containing protein [Desulfobacteria bacterium]|nr:Spo0B domain-containing protein [Desulfobacteria bacterium]